MDLGISRPHAVVTGAGRGIGRATARLLCEAGAEVLLVARTDAEIQRRGRRMRPRRRAVARRAPPTSRST